MAPYLGDGHILLILQPSRVVASIKKKNLAFWRKYSRSGVFASVLALVIAVFIRRIPCIRTKPMQSYESLCTPRRPMYSYETLSELANIS